MSITVTFTCHYISLFARFFKAKKNVKKSTQADENKIIKIDKDEQVVCDFFSVYGNLLFGKSKIAKGFRIVDEIKITAHKISLNINDIFRHLLLECNKFV